MFDFWMDTRERWLLFGAVVALVLLVIVKVKLEVPETMKGPEWATWVSFFQAEAFEDIVGDLLTGLIGAYFFYVLIDLLPRHKRENAVLNTLNLIIASVVDAYEHRRTFGHETPISLNDVKILEKKNIQRHLKHIATLSEKITINDYYALRCAVDCVDSRMHDFRNVLPLTVTLSPDHVLQWLQVIDRARLLHEQFDRVPVGLDGCFEAQHAFGHPSVGMNSSNQVYVDYKNHMHKYAITLALRMMQFLREVEAWMDLSTKGDMQVMSPKSDLTGT